MTNVPPSSPTPPPSPQPQAYVGQTPPSAQPPQFYGAAPQPIYVCPPAAHKPSFIGRMFHGLGWLIFIGSLVMNVYLLVALAAMSIDGMDSEMIVSGSEDQIVAIYSVNTVINEEAASKFREFYRYVQDNTNIRAVVIRVQSPGGGVAASEEIHHMIKEIKASGRPVVVSMGGVAASGGYMISAPADEIFAEPSTVTGSIGVIAQVPNLMGTMEKIGVEMMTFKSSHAQGWKDMLSPFKSPQSYERKRITEILDSIQASFEKIVREGRGDRLKPEPESYEMTVGEGDEKRTVTVKETAPFNGKVYLTPEALKLGLIDKTGYLSDAYDRAAELAGLHNPTVRQYKTHEGLFGKMFSSKAGAVNIDLSPETLDKFQTPRMLVLWTMD